MSQWIKTVSGHSIQEKGPFLFIVFCIDQNICLNKLYIHNQTKESHYFLGVEWVEICTKPHWGPVNTNEGSHGRVSGLMIPEAPSTLLPVMVSGIPTCSFLGSDHFLANTPALLCPSRVFQQPSALSSLAED